MTESEIVRGLSLAKERDSAMRQLTERFGPKLFQRIRSIVTVEADAQDVYQNTLIKVLRGIKTFKANSSLYSWLYRIASNEALDFLRKRSRTASTPFGKTDDDNVNDSPIKNQVAESHGFDASEIETLLTAAIAELPQQQRLVFEARYFNETPYAKLAMDFSKSEGALKANYHHAVHKITAFMQAHAPISIS